MDLEHARKEAKALLHAFARRDVQALARAEAVLGERATERFLLSDAQHVIGVERGYHSWRELRATLRFEQAVETGLFYRTGDPVRVYVVRRAQRVTVTDAGAALARAAVALPWRTVADRLERELDVNISRTGAVSLPVVPVGPGEAAIVDRIGRASLIFYQDLLELE